MARRFPIPELGDDALKSSDRTPPELPDPATAARRPGTETSPLAAHTRSPRAMRSSTRSAAVISFDRGGA